MTNRLFNRVTRRKRIASSSVRINKHRQTAWKACEVVLTTHDTGLKHERATLGRRTKHTLRHVTPPCPYTRLQRKFSCHCWDGSDDFHFQNSRDYSHQAQSSCLKLPYPTIDRTPTLLHSTPLHSTPPESPLLRVFPLQEGALESPRAFIHLSQEISLFPVHHPQPPNERLHPSTPTPSYCLAYFASSSNVESASSQSFRYIHRTLTRRLHDDKSRYEEEPVDYTPQNE